MLCVHLFIESSSSKLLGPKDQLKDILEHFSFIDKSAENQLARWKKGLFWKEKGIIAQHGELHASYLEWKAKHTKLLKSNIKVYACTILAENNKDYLIVPTGLTQSLLKYLNAKSIKVTITDKREFALDRRKLIGAKPPTLRRPQEEALNLIKSERNVAVKGLGLVRLATGTGKTALAQELIRHFGLKSIFLVPSLPILDQTLRRFEDAYGKKNVRAYGGGKKDMGFITVATYQSVYKADPNDFDDVHVVVADECHHIAADTFNEVMTVKLKNAVHRYGLTAFEERADDSTILIEASVGPVIYQYDAPEAIEDGYLARPTFMFYDVYHTHGKWTKYTMKDGKRTAVKDEMSVAYNGDDGITAYRNWVLGNNILNEFVANLVNEFVGDTQSVLILVDEKEHGDRLVELLKAHGIAAGYAIGGGKDNVQLQKDFNSRKLKVLIGTSCLSEGADLIPVDILINMLGGASKSKILQAVGRGLRNDPDENGVPQKPTVLVIDFNFPECKMLTRHSGIREKVCEPMGKVYHSKLP